MSETQDEPRINPAFVKYDTMGPEELIKAMHEASVAAAKLELEAKPFNDAFEYLRLVKIPAVFDERDIKNLAVTGLSDVEGNAVSVRCALTSDIYASIKAGQKDAAYQWFRDNGRGDLIKETVAPGTLKSSAKAAMVKGEPFPEDLFNVTPFTRAGLTKV